MTSKRHILSIICSCAFLLHWASTNAQVVWPGDINNNGIVNGVDVLYLGWAYGQTGPARAEVNTDWEAMPAPASWGGQFPDGINFYFADADGSGEVDMDDFDDAVRANFAEEHDALSTDNYANATPGGNAPALELRPLVSVLGVGAEARFELFLGSSTHPVAAAHGVAVHASYFTANGSSVGELDFEIEATPWLATGDANFIDFNDHYPNNDARMDVAMTRTDRQNVSGGGKLGEYSVIIEDIVVGLNIDTLFIQIDSVRLIDANGFTNVPAVPARSKVIIAKDPSSVVKSTDLLSPQQLPIYPNPATNGACLHIANDKVVALQLVAPDGRAFPLHWRPEQGGCIFFQWPPSLPTGAYLVRVLTEEGIKYGRFFLIH